jgi:hypothetical protein
MAIIGSPLSKALQGGLVQRTVSSSVFGGAGLRLNPISGGSDPETLAVANQNTSDITSLRNQIGSLQQQVYSLVNQNIQFASEITKITSVQKQVDSIQNQVSLVNSTVLGLSQGQQGKASSENLTVTTKINDNTNSILDLQKKVTNLQDQNQQIIIGVTNNIGALQKQVSGLEEQVIDFSSALDRISVLIANTSSVDQLREQFQNEQERRSAELGLRRGKEKALESRIQQALTEPVKRLGTKLQFGLESLLNGLMWIFGGWLTRNVIDLLGSYARKDWNLFDKIKNSIISNTVTFLRALTFIKTGVFRLIGAVLRLAGDIAKFLIVSPIKALFGGAAKLLGLGGKGAAEAGVKAGSEAAAKVGGEKAAKVGGKIAAKGTEEALAKGGVRMAAGATPLLGAVTNTAFGIYDLMRGKTEAAGYDFLAAGASASTPLTGPFGEAAELAFSAKAIYSDVTTPDKDSKELEKERKKSNKPASAVTKPAVKSQSPMMQGSATSSTSSAASVSGSTKPIATPTQTLQPKAAQLSSNATQNSADVGSSKSKDFISPAQMQAPPKAEPPKAEPPAKPNIVYTTTGTSKPNGPDTTPSPTRGTPVSDVPAIASSDPDNFYALYSQINYNVVL